MLTAVGEAKKEPFETPIFDVTEERQSGVEVDRSPKYPLGHLY